MKTKKFDELLKKLYSESEIKDAKKRAKLRAKKYPLEKKLFDEKSIKNINFGKFIKQLRQINKLSVRELSQISDLSNYQIKQIENELMNPTLEVALIFAKSLRYPEDSFIEVCLNTLFRNANCDCIVKLNNR